MEPFDITYQLMLFITSDNIYSPRQCPNHIYAKQLISYWATQYSVHHKREPEGAASKSQFYYPQTNMALIDSYQEGVISVKDFRIIETKTAI